MRVTFVLGLLAFLPSTCCYAASAEFSFIHMIRGNQVDKVQSVALGTDQSIYLAGTTSSTNFVTTAGAVHPSVQPGGTAQAFLRRLSADGSQILFSALLGECSGNVAMALDPQGNVYVALESANTTWGSPVQVLEPSGSVVLLKISGTGDKLLYGAMLMPEGFYGSPLALAVDSSGAAYLGTGTGTVAIRKIDPSGGTIAYKYQFTCSDTYFSPLVDSLALGPDRSLHIAGRASCTGFPTTPGAWRTSNSSPQNSDGYLMRLKPDGSGPIYSTLVGGGGPDEVYSVTVDSTGAAIVAGTTYYGTQLSPFSAQPIGFTPVNGSSYGFLAEFDATGSKLVYSFLLPPSDLSAVTLDGGGAPIVAGTTSAGVVLAKLDPKTGSLNYWMNPPADRARIPSIAWSGGTVAFGGWTASFAFPNDDPNPVASNAYGGFAGKVAMPPPTTNLVLTTKATAARPDIYGSTNSCLFHLQNLGQAAADDILLLAGDDLQDFGSWQAEQNGFVVPSLRHVSAGPVHVSLPKLAPGASADIAFQGSGQCTGVVQTSTAEAILTDNTASDDYRPIATATFVVSATYRGMQFQRDDWPVMSAAGSSLAVPVGGSVRIYFPSPQNSVYYGPLVFKSWLDGVTDNPRKFPVAGQDMGAVADFTPLSTPWFDAAAGLVNGATSQTGNVAPGEVVVLYGWNLGSFALTTAGLGADGSYVRQLSGYTVTFDGVAAPFLYASSGQTSVIVPYEVAGKSSVNMVVNNGKGGTFSATIGVTDTSPGLFTANSVGTGQAAALNQDGRLNSLYYPAARGDIVVLYATGEGVSNPVPGDGAITGTNPAKPVAAVSVSIGGQNAEVLYAGAAPGLVAGVMQVNVRIPAGITPGNRVPVVLAAGQNSSAKGVTIAVR